MSQPFDALAIKPHLRGGPACSACPLASSACPLTSLGSHPHCCPPRPGIGHTRQPRASAHLVPSGMLLANHCRLPAQFTLILPSHLDSHYAWASDNLLRLHDGAERTSSRNCMVFVRKPGGSTDWNGTSPHHFLTCQRQDVQVALDHFSWTERNGTASMGKALTI